MNPEELTQFRGEILAHLYIRTVTANLPQTPAMIFQAMKRAGVGGNPEQVAAALQYLASKELAESKAHPLGGSEAARVWKLTAKGADAHESQS